MAIPASYSEATLKAYMHAVLAAVATTLGWTVDGGHYDEAANEAVAAYGVDDVADVSGRDNIRKLRALARREVWRAVMQATASHYDLNTDGASRDRSQIHAHAAAQYAMADAECEALGADALTGAAYQAGADTISYADPYGPPGSEA
jgi:hypothetical protein